MILKKTLKKQALSACFLNISLICSFSLKMSNILGFPFCETKCDFRLVAEFAPKVTRTFGEPHNGENKRAVFAYTHAYSVTKTLN